MNNNKKNSHQTEVQDQRALQMNSTKHLFYFIFSTKHLNRVKYLSLTTPKNWREINTSNLILNLCLIPALPWPEIKKMLYTYFVLEKKQWKETAKEQVNCAAATPSSLDSDDFFDNAGP